MRYSEENLINQKCRVHTVSIEVLYIASETKPNLYIKKNVELHKLLHTLENQIKLSPVSTFRTIISII